MALAPMATVRDTGPCMSTVETSSNLLQQLDYSVLQQCIHCGLCLPTCPTYDATKNETSSPRGRIALMRAVADGKLSADSPKFSEEMYFCLGCLACETVCPANVQYHEMLEMARAVVSRPNFLMRLLFCSPRRLKVAAKLLRFYQISGLRRLISALLPRKLRELDAMQPEISAKFSRKLIAEHEVPRGKSPKFRVGLLVGCIQDVAFADVNRDTVDVLLRNGCEVFTPRGQVCCGSLLGHLGDLDAARELSRKNAEIFGVESLDAVIVNVAGCGSFMKHDGNFAGKVRDVSEFLMEIGIEPPKISQKLRVTYQEACHLAHGQKIFDAPRALLRAIPNVELVEMKESTWCCGSAGIYNITHREMAAELLERKLKNIGATGAEVVATGNAGCMLQLRAGVRARGMGVEVVHAVSLLARAYRLESER
jgi:glycolate oxidase iron-sulfur subunit